MHYPNEDFLPYESQFSSQHREDGIIDMLCSHVKDPDHWAIEIGSGNGDQNMIRNLIENREYHGIGHDLQPARWLHERYDHRIVAVMLGQIGVLTESWPTKTPDFFSLDIDSFDFWVLKDLLYNHDFRPAVMCLEYLSYFRDQIASVRPDLPRYKLAALGCSLGAYQLLTERFGYRFFTVDTCGVNGFFYLPNRMAKLEQLEQMPRHTWRMYPRYAKHIIETDNPAMEFDPVVLFENNTR
jgi:hypothetical protein